MPLPVPRRKAQHVRRYYDLPSLTALASFEAAARHLSVKAAAEELNVTPGAVSRQIKALEAELGLALFTRLHRGLALTREGEELAGVLARGFGQVALLLRDFRGRSQGRNVTLGSSNAFASLWLMPRLGAFWRAHPEITVNHMISDRAADLRVPEVELRIRYGGGASAGEEAERLFRSCICAARTWSGPPGPSGSAACTCAPRRSAGRSSPTTRSCCRPPRRGRAWRWAGSGWSHP